MRSFNITYLNIPDGQKKVIEDFISEWNSPSLSMSTYTSGSTGKPKKVDILKSKMRKSACMTGEFLELQKGEKAFLCISPDTIGGKMMIVRAIELKLELIVSIVCSDPLQNLNTEVDFVAMVPMQLSNSLENSLEALKKIKNIIIGGGVISSKLEDKLRENEMTVYQTYGMTETISHVAMRRVGVHQEEFYTAVGENSFAVKDGRLVIHSLLAEHETITTNDIIKLIDSKHFKWIGRADFVINSGGIKIHPEEVEIKLENHITPPFFIAGLKDDYLGEKVVLCIESAPFKIDKIDLQNSLTKYEYPKEIYFIPKFTRTDSGKINRLKTLFNLKMS